MSGVLASSSHFTRSTPVQSSGAESREGENERNLKFVRTTEHRFLPLDLSVRCVGRLTSTHTTQCECQRLLGPREVALYLHNNEEGGIGGLWEQEKIMFSFFSSRRPYSDTRHPSPPPLFPSHTQNTASSFGTFCTPPSWPTLNWAVYARPLRLFLLLASACRASCILRRPCCAAVWCSLCVYRRETSVTNGRSQQELLSNYPRSWTQYDNRLASTLGPHLDVTIR